MNSMNGTTGSATQATSRNRNEIDRQAALVYIRNAVKVLDAARDAREAYLELYGDKTDHFHDQFGQLTSEVWMDAKFH